MEAVLHEAPELESIPLKKGIDRRNYFEASLRKRILLEAFNQVARAKAQLVASKQMRPDQFVREMDREAKRHGFELTLDAYRTFAELFAAYSEHQQALKYYQRASQMAPGAFESIADLGAGLGRLGRYEESLKYLGQALEKKPNHPRVLNNLGASYHALGRTDEARECFARAHQGDPEYATPLLNEGNLLCETGNHEKALALYRQALTLPSPPPIAHILSGYCLMEMNRFPEALESFRSAAKSGMDAPPVYLNTASALLALGRLTEASGMLEGFSAHPLAKQWLTHQDVRQLFELLRRGILRANETIAAPGQLRILNDRQAREGVAAVRATLTALQKSGFGQQQGPKASGDASSDVV